VDALTQGAAAQDVGQEGAARDAKRRKVVSPDLLHGWRELQSHTGSVQRHLLRASGGADGQSGGVVTAPVFAFVEGALVTALREGHWLLLDEINLAPVETLERLASILEVRLPPGFPSSLPPLLLQPRHV
jgi:midasin